MTTSRLTRASRLVAVLAALTAGLSATLGAQAPQPVGGSLALARITAVPDSPREGEPSTAETRRAAARSAMAAQRKEMAPDLAERLVWNTARNEPAALLRGIKLTPAERASLNAIRQRYLNAFADSRNRERTAQQGGHADPSIGAMVRASRYRQREELRKALTPAHQAQYDRNVAALASGS